MQRTNIYLSAEQLDALDATASAEGVSRAEVIRRILDLAISADDDDSAADVAAIAESFGVLSAEDLMCGRGPDARTQHLDRLAGS